MSPEQAFENDLHRDIPISKHMGARVLSIATDHVRLAAPLAPNSNHKQTAFGGSVHSIAVLSCWGLVSTALKEAGFFSDYIVIQDSHIEYLKPVDGDFEAESAWASESVHELFLKTLARHGLARVQVRSEVRVNGEVRATLSGRFVAQVKRD